MRAAPTSVEGGADIPAAVTVALAVAPVAIAAVAVAVALAVVVVAPARVGGGEVAKVFLECTSAGAGRLPAGLLCEGVVWASTPPC